MGTECSCGYTSKWYILWRATLTRMSYCICFPSKILAETLEFFPDAKIRCMLIVAPLLQIADADINIIQRLQAKLERPGYRTILPYENCSGPKHSLVFHHSPIETLRGELIHLRRRSVLDHHQDQLLDLLQWESEGRMDVDTPGLIPLTYPQLDEAPPDIQSVIERALVQVLWDEPRLHSVRLRLFLTRFCSVCIPRMTVSNLPTKAHFRKFHTSPAKLLSTLPRTWIGIF